MPMKHLLQARRETERQTTLATQVQRQNQAAKARQDRLLLEIMRCSLTVEHARRVCQAHKQQVYVIRVVI